jgi:hypothetical protein
MKLEGKSELFRMLAPPGECPECGDASSCECPLADSYRQIDAPKPPDCPYCLDSGYRRDWSGKRVGCDCCYPDNGKD